MPAFYRSTLREFLDTTKDIAGELAFEKADYGFFNVESAQLLAWREQLLDLKNSLSALCKSFPSAFEWTLLLEFPMIRRQRRIDGVLLARDLIFVLEFKTAISKNDWSAMHQAEDYALELADFHFPSHNRTIIPMVVAAGQSRSTFSATDSRVQPVMQVNPDELHTVLQSVYQLCSKPENAAIDPLDWDNGVYHPVRSIIEAATALYSGMKVREIAHSHSSAENLNESTGIILNAMREAQKNKGKIICFVTGIPGAGKTLVGLNLVHHPEMQNEERPASVFMSGNGPLVKILRRALADDWIARENQKQPRTERVKRKEVEREVSTLIQNIHQFVKDNLTRDAAQRPYENVIVFDEAQRAWNSEKNRKRHRKKDSRWHVSEAEMVLNIMDRHDWAVVVALVGGGQEIHEGEAGLAEWGRAFKSKFSHWHVLASPEALDGGSSLAGSILFPQGSGQIQITLARPCT